MKLIKGLSLVAAAFLTVGMVACSDDEGGNNGGAESITSNPNTGASPTTPAEEKQFIETTATEVKNLLKPEDQQDFLDFCKAFSQEFSGFIDDEDDYYYNDYYGGDYMIKGIADLKKSVAHYDLLGMTRAIQEISYSFTKVAGVYTPDFTDNEWKKTGESSNVEYQFKVNGQDCQLVITPANGEWSANGNVVMEEDESPYDEYTAHFTIAVPRTLNLKLTQGSKTLLTAVCNNDFNKAGKAANCNIDATLANINFKAVANLTNTQCVANVVATVSGTPVMTVNGVLNGKDMCDLDRILSIINNRNDRDDDDDNESWITNSNNIHSLFTDGVANINLMQRIFVAGTCDSMSRVAFTFSNWDDEDETSCRSDLETINKHIKSDFYLGGAKEPTGTFVWQLQKEVDWGWGSSYTYWYAEPAMKFNSDGSTYRFVEYFNENDFASTVQVFESLADLYSAFWGK